MITLTQNEIVALELTLNYKTREAQLEDNFSDADVMDIGMKLGWKKKQVQGLLVSLQNKGMGHIVEGTGTTIEYFQMNDLGVNTIFDIIEARA